MTRMGMDVDVVEGIGRACFIKRLQEKRFRQVIRPGFSGGRKRRGDDDRIGAFGSNPLGGGRQQGSIMVRVNRPAAPMPRHNHPHRGAAPIFFRRSSRAGGRYRAPRDLCALVTNPRR